MRRFNVFAWPDGDEATIVQRDLVDYWEGER
jgi:hypothetical protein